MFHSAKLAKTASQALARAAFTSGVLPSYTRVSFCSHLRRSQQRACQQLRLKLRKKRAALDTRDSRKRKKKKTEEEMCL